jgi:MATE family multidrug resistance protein
MDAVRRDLLPTLRLAWPVIVAELGWMLMGVVDTVMVGRVAPEAIGAVGLGSILYFSAAIFGMGLLLGLDTFVSQAHGAGSLRECHRWLRDGVHLAVLATLPLMAITFAMVAALPVIGLHPHVQALTSPYITAVAWGSLPLLLYAAFRRYLQALGIVSPVMITLVVANLVNAAGNWVLIYGHFG